jgi:protein-L-isoaspartate(D-aspartate) O-methyltransferase
VTDELLRRYATNVTAGVEDRAIVAAFARVPRELFVRRLLEPDGTFVPATPERVYVDDALVTRLRDGVPSSSSSQPSLMARMLAELDLRPGLRVLEIGVGTGYNAALVATITGGPVVSVDVQADVVDEAREALARAGVGDRTRVVLGDGFRGAPQFGPYDRIIATVGIGGVPAAWLDQLAPGGLILGPMEHGGFQPCVAAAPTDDGPPVGRGVLASGFMLAAGPLHPHAGTPAPLEVAEPPPVIRIPDVEPGRYYDLWFWLAAQDRRVARRAVPGYDGDGVRCVFADPVDGVVLVQLDALRPIGASPELIRRVVDLVDGWHAAGRPPVRAWRCGFDFSAGLWTPARWSRVATPGG